MKITILILLLSLSLGAQAQLNDSVNYHVKLSSTGVVNQTNNQRSYLLNNRINFSAAKEWYKANLSAGHIYGKQNQTQTNNDFNAAADFNIYQTQRFYYWGLAGYTSSFSLKIIDRYQAGLGAAYDLVYKPAARINLSNGILYESSHLYRADSTRDKYQTFRNSFRLSYKFTYQSVVILEGTHFVQNALGMADDYILLSNNNLSVKISSWLSITAALTYNRVNRTSSENLLINYGLSIEKFF